MKFQSFCHSQRDIIRTLIWSTVKEGIARHSLRTTTSSYMIIDFTQRIISADSYTWIGTFMFDTSQMPFTIIILNAFGTTSLVRIALWIFRCTCALAVIADGISRARRGVTRVIKRRFFCYYNKESRR